MRALVGWSQRFRLLVLGIALGVMVLGVALLPKASVDTLPEFGPPYVEVQTEALGLSAEEVEQLITVPLEANLLNGVAWLDSIESQSVQGLSSVVLTFEPGTDPIRARQMVAERLTQAHALPNVSRPPVMLQPLSSANRLMMVSLNSEKLSPIEMSVLARWTIRPRLMGVQGVANVAIWGQRERQLQVLVDPERLRDANVTLGDVVETTGNALWVSPLSYIRASTPGTGGWIDTPNQRLGVQHLFPIDTADDLGRVAIQSTDPNAPRLRLHDVADVVEDNQPLIGDAIVGNSQGLLLVVEKFPEANTIEVTRGVENALAAMQPGLGGVEVDPTIFRPASFIESAIANTGLAALIGLLLLALVLGALFFDWRAALISLITLPVSLIAAALVLHLTGNTLNTLSAAGLIAAMVIVIHDVVIGTAAATRRNGTPPSPSDTTARIVAAHGPMTYATVAMVLAAVPLFVLGGVTGALLPSAVAAYLLAVGASMIVAITVAPALAALLVRRGSSKSEEPRVIAWLQRPYLAVLRPVVARRRAAMTIAALATMAVVAIFAGSMAPMLGRSGMPAFQDRDILVHWNGAPGTSHTEMARIVEAASSELRAVAGVRQIGAHVGRAVTSDQVVGINAGEIWVSLEPDADYDATLAAIESVAAGYPGLDRQVLTHGEERLTKFLGETDQDVAVRIFGSDLSSMREKAIEVQDALRGIAGIEAAAVEPQIDEPVVDIRVDLDAAGDVGLSPGDVRRAAATLLSGIQVGSLFEQQKVFEVVVWGKPELRQSVTAIRELLIETPEAGLVRLEDVADVSIGSSPTAISRNGVQRAIDVGAMIRGRDVNAVLADVDAALGSIAFPMESHAEVLGFAAEREWGRMTLLALTAAAAIGILLLLQAAFASWLLALLVFLSLPATLLGGIVVAAAIGEYSIGTTLGLVAVLGLAIRDGIGQVDRFRSIRRTTQDGADDRIVLQSAREQLQPMLITAAATAAVLLPFAVLGGRTGLEIIQPMALVTLGGLVTSSLINLFIVPALIPRSGASAQPEMVSVPIEQVADPTAVGAR
jgi:Cu/Ag efflux pump CusA